MKGFIKWVKEIFIIIIYGGADDSSPFSQVVDKITSPIIDWKRRHFDYDRYVKWFFQRGKRGWADCDTWNFDWYLSNVIIGGLEYFRDNNHSYPSELSSVEEWNSVLDQMIDGFKSWQKIVGFGNGEYFSKLTDELGEKEASRIYEQKLAEVEEKMSLLIKWYGNLWD